MSFRLNQDDMINIMSVGNATFVNAQVAWIIWETESSIVQEFLPPGLSMVDPYALAYVADYPTTNFSLPYQESALFLAVQSETGKFGLYCVAMPVTDEVALFAGRLIGYPKKLAHIHYEETKNIILGYTERYNRRFMEIRLDLTKLLNINSDNKISKYLTAKGGMVFNILDVIPEPLDVTSGKEYIIHQRIKSKPERALYCEAEILLTPSKYDPWVNIPIKKVLCGFAFRGYMKITEAYMDHQIEVAQGFPLAFPRMSDMHHFIQKPDRRSDIAK